ncbi:hypothetical protein F4776DRAFT_670298 [Hypoxylon sp. NC0597]|nr:hypothetical protein F4776DRAFT_670298 [Hypoxylon sp. NC0597]
MYYNTLPRIKLRTSRTCTIKLDSLNETRESFINICCGNGEKRCSLDNGLRIFAAVVEMQMMEYETATTDILNIFWGSQPETTYLERQFRTCSKIVSLIRSSTVQTTIDDIVKQLCDYFKVSMLNDNTHGNALRHLIFAVIGWSTMLYTPTFKSADSDFSTTMKYQNTQWFKKHSVAHVTDSSRRPIGAVLRNHGLIPIACPLGAESSEGSPTLLSVPHLNFYSLSKIGDVTITWVDNLSEHCKFDRYSRTKQLKLFRLPSLCATICLNRGDEALIGRLFRNHSCQQKCQARSETEARSYLIGVLLSYRLIFGQHALSRRIFRERERENAKWNGSIDPLLDALCGQEYVNGFDGAEDLLRERGVYDAHINFPHLGERLMDLADYSVTQKPRNLLEVWNDQRDPERLFTFKAVIIIGVLTIILGVLQVFVGVAQIAVSLQKQT